VVDPLDAFWEPRQFSVGDRVRVRLSPECRCYAIRTRPGCHFDGAIGTVIGRYVPRSYDSVHMIKVVPDLPFTTDFTVVPENYYCVFAAIELEALEPGR
jgi:hypothetical protein